MAKKISCIICGISDYKVLFKEHEAQINRIVKCVNCGFMYANPQNKIDPEKFSKEQKLLPPISSKDLNVQKNYIQLADYKKIAAFINKEKNGKGKLLEVGAFIGVFLNYLNKQGWDVVGLEPNVRAVKYAKEHFGLNILPTTLENSNFPKETFDVIVMAHVIEHLFEPAESLFIVNNILKRNGLLIIETPTYDTLMFRLLGRRERSISCNGHLFFFTLMSLKRLLEQNGFKVIQQELVGRTLSLERLLWNIGVISKSNLIKNFIENISNFLKLKKIVIHLNMRDMQRVYCIKI